MPYSGYIEQMNAEEIVVDKSFMHLYHYVSALPTSEPEVGMLLADNLYEHALFAPPVELAVEDLLPRSKVEISVSYGDHHLPSHDLAFKVCIAVVLTGAIVAVIIDGFVGGKLFKPVLVVLVEPRFVIIDKDTGGDMHGVDKAETFFNSAFCNCLAYFFRDVDKGDAHRGIKPEFFAQKFHLCLLMY